MQPLTDRFTELAGLVRLLASDRDALSSGAHLRLSATQRSLYASYLLLLPFSVSFVWNAMSADLAMFIELGARDRAIDIFVVLCRFLFDHYPETGSLLQDVETGSGGIDKMCARPLSKPARDDA